MEQEIRCAREPKKAGEVRSPVVAHNATLPAQSLHWKALQNPGQDTAVVVVVETTARIPCRCGP